MSILSFFPSGSSGGGSGFLDVAVYSSLPVSVTDGQIAVITSITPPCITVDTVTPTSPSVGDVFIEIASGNNLVSVEGDPLIVNFRPQSIKQYSGSFFDQIEAHIGVEGEWRQVSSGVTTMGVSYNTAASSPTFARLGAAEGKSAVAGVGTTSQISDFDTMPIYRDIKLCNLSAGGIVNAYQGESGFSRTGSNGDVMVEIPKFWYKIVSGTVQEWWIADGPAEGFTLHPAFNRGGIYSDLDHIYVAAYETASGYVSKSGAAPLVSITRAAARTGSAGKGSGWGQLDIAAVMAVNLLMYIEYASLDLQSSIGPGNSNTSSKINTGGSDSMAGHTGRAAGTATSVAVKWRGIENWWGNVWKWVDGININGGKYYFNILPGSYADDTDSGYTQAGYTVGTSLSSSYIKTLGLDASAPWFRMPTAGGGSATTYFCDGCWTGTGWRVARLGGTYSNDTICGPSAWYLYNTSSNSNASIGCRLLYCPVGG